MVQETSYGILSDVHDNPYIVRHAVNLLKSLGAEVLIANGDIGEWQGNLQASQEYLAIILETLGESGLESYFHPGSHEKISVFDPVSNHFKEKYPNLISTFESPKVEANGHHLVFLPGSDFVSGGEYIITNDENTPSGLYVRTKKGLVAHSVEAHEKTVNEDHFGGHIRFSNMNDLRGLVTEPDKTIVICHVPRRFEGNIDQAVDMAYFGESNQGGVIPGAYLEQELKERVGDNISEKLVEHFAMIQGITIKRENRGNEDLRDLYKELGVTKAVSGHFHESGHRAHDGNVIPVPEGETVGELYWNSGQLDKGQTGILKVRDGAVSFQNIQLEDYLPGLMSLLSDE